MNETNNTDRYIGILNSHILPFIDYDRLLKSYETDMVYAKGILNWLHTAMVMAYDGEVLDEYAGDEGFVIIPGVIRGKESGKMCLALLELDLTSSGEHYGTAFLCQYGLLSQKAAYGTDTVLAAQAKEISRQIGAYDYGYTAKIPGDIHIDAARLPDAMKDILDGFWKHSTELLPDSASPVVGMGADGENIREEIRVLMNAVVIENQMMELMDGQTEDNTAPPTNDKPDGGSGNEKTEVQRMKLVYVASPVRGDIAENLKKANRYCEYIAGCGHIPVAPHLAWQGFLPESPENREKALAMGLKLIEYCSEVWVCGDEISQGMQGEIEAAEKLRKPVLYVLQERIDENMKIRQTLEPLGPDDCIPGSREQDYGNKILVLNPETLIRSGRNAQNSLWIAYNGFGCTYGARGQAVYAKNLFDGRESRWERADFLGIVKPGSLQKWLDDMPVKNETAQTAAHEAERDDELER